MCKFSLHLVTCHAYNQETANGSTSKSMEWWVEQSIRQMKKVIENGPTRHPAKVVANDVLLHKALIDRGKEYPEYAALVGLAEAPEVADFKGPTDALEGGIQLLHVGKRLRLEAIEQSDLVSLGQQAERIRGFSTDSTLWKVHEFRAAQVDNEVFQARNHYRTAARQSFNVQIRFQSGQSRQATLHFATIQRFLRVTDTQTGAYFRVADVIIFKKAKEERGLSVIDTSQPLRQGELVPLSSLLTNYMFARDEKRVDRFYVLPCFSKGP